MTEEQEQLQDHIVPIEYHSKQQGSHQYHQDYYASAIARSAESRAGNESNRLRNHRHVGEPGCRTSLYLVKLHELRHPALNRPEVLRVKPFTTSAPIVNLGYRQHQT